jgi:hypothetical protein
MLNLKLQIPFNQLVIICNLTETGSGSGYESEKNHSGSKTHRHAFVQNSSFLAMFRICRRLVVNLLLSELGTVKR